MNAIKSIFLRGVKLQTAALVAVFVLSAQAVVHRVDFVTETVDVEGVATVTTNMNASVDALRAAILSASAGDVVELAAGTWEITNRIEIAKSITLRGATDEDGAPILKVNDEPATEIKNILNTSVEMLTQTANINNSSEVKRYENCGQQNAQVIKLDNNCRVESLTLSDGYLYGVGSDETVKNSYRGSVIQMTDAVVSNCVIQGGRGWGCVGSGYHNSMNTVGVYMKGTRTDSVYNSRLENCIIRNNYNRQANEVYVGGGVYIDTNGQLSHCVITNNVSRGAGGGVALAKGSDAMIDNCVIVGNYSGYTIDKFGDRAKENKLVTDNGWEDRNPLNCVYDGMSVTNMSGANGCGGGGVWGYASGSTLNCKLVNCLVAGNYARRGSQPSSERLTTGAVSEAKLYGCTVLDNTWDSVNGTTIKPSGTEIAAVGGLYKCEAYNTVSWGNEMRNMHVENDPNWCVSDYDPATSLIYSYTSKTNDPPSVVDGGNNIFMDPGTNPGFVSHTLTNAAGFLRGFTYPFASQKLVNKGGIDTETVSYTSGATADLDGLDRNMNDRPDIGCVELWRDDFRVTMVPSPTHNSAELALTVGGLAADETITLTVEIADNESFTDSMTLDALHVTENGTFSQSVTGLEMGTTYYARANIVSDDPQKPAQIAFDPFVTYPAPFSVYDDLTVDERGITLNLDKVFDTIEVSMVIDGEKTLTWTTNEAAEIVVPLGPLSGDESFTVTADSVVEVTISAPGYPGVESVVLRTGDTIYVNPTGSDASDGKNRDHPKATIPNALAAARANGNIKTIVLTVGEHYQWSGIENAAVVDMPIRIVGETDGEARAIIKDGQKSSDNSWTNASLIVAHEGAVITNVVFKGRKYENDSTNRETRRPVRMESGTLTDCEISGFQVSANIDGGGIYMTGGTVVNCVLTDIGSARYGGGVYMTGGTVRNTLIHGNSGNINGLGTALYQTGGSVESSTIVNNGVSIGCTQVFAGAGARIVNTIIWHTAGVGKSLAREDGSDITYTCVAPLTAGEGNIDEPPAFVSVAESDYHLNNCLAVNGGKQLDWMTEGATDLDGNPRVDGTGVDIGCCEMVNAPSQVIGLSPNSAVFIGGAEQTFTAILRGIETEGLAYVWNFGDGTPEVTTQTATVPHVFEPGKHQVTLTVKRGSETVGVKSTAAESFVMYGAAIYVDAEGLETFPYDTRAKAAKTVAKALADSTDGIEILVAPGVRSESKITVAKPVTIRSFDPNHPTEINGGERTSDNIISVESDGVTLRNLSFSNAKTISRTVRLQKPCLMESCIITNNLGGGLDAVAGVVVRNCLIADNSTDQNWNGVGVNMNGGTIENCTIVGNKTGKVNYRDGVGVWLNNANSTVQNCVIAGNGLVDGTEVAEGTEVTDLRTANSANIRNTCYGSATGTVPSGQDNFVVDGEKPLFENAAGGNYRPSSAGSQLRDAGRELEWHAGALDLDGMPRVAGKAVDIGCYEPQKRGFFIFLR